MDVSPEALSTLPEVIKQKDKEIVKARREYATILPNQQNQLDIDGQTTMPLAAIQHELGTFSQQNEVDNKFENKETNRENLKDVRPRKFGKLNMHIMYDAKTLNENEDYNLMRKTIYHKKDIQKTKEILSEVRNAAENANRLYLVVDGPIGDSVIATGYIRAIQEAMREQLGKDIPISLVVAGASAELFAEYSKYGFEVIKTPKQEAWDGLDAIIESHPEEKRILAVELGLRGLITLGRGTAVERQQTRFNQTVTKVEDLLVPMLSSYRYNMMNNNDQFFARAVEDFLSLERNSLHGEIAQPFIPLDPDTMEADYMRIARNSGIDINNPRQISIVVEASSLDKRYGLTHWATVMQELHTRFPNYQFNIIHNLQSNQEGFRPEDITNMLQQNGLTECSHLVSGSLKELAALLREQHLVLSNDTGLAHVAAAIPDGPPIVVPSVVAREEVWMWSKKHNPITLPPALRDSRRIKWQLLLDSISSRENRVINRLPPQEIVEKSTELLKSIEESEEYELQDNQLVLGGVR